MAEDRQFFVGQKAFIEKDGKLLLLIDPRNEVDLPGGKIQIGENDLDESLRREVREETGLEIEIGKPFTRWYFEFKPGHRNAGKQVYLVGFRCAYKSGEVVISDEHSHFVWVDKEGYKKYADGSGHYKAVEEYFNIMNI